MAELTERRAWFVYESARLAAIAARAPIVPESWDDREEPFKVQFMACIERQCGEMRSRSPEELHGSWMQAYIDMGWVYGPERDPEKKTHPDMVPYADLVGSMQEIRAEKAKIALEDTLADLKRRVDAIEAKAALARIAVTDDRIRFVILPTRDDIERYAKPHGSFEER